MSYYGYGSATGRMSPAESWNQMYLGGDVWTGAREIDPELRSLIREFEGLQWSELPADIQELWKQMGNYRPSGESIATESQKLECPNCGRNNGMWTLDDGSGDDFVCVWCNRGTTIERVTELNNLSQAEVMNQVLEDEQNPKTHDFWNAGESKTSNCPFNPNGENHEFIKDENSDVTCKHCGEEVTDYEVKLWGESVSDVDLTCGMCNGTGEIYLDSIVTCHECGGTGKITFDQLPQWKKDQSTESKATEVSVFDWWDKVTHDGSDIARQWEGTHFNELPIGRQNHYFNIYMEELGADKYGDHEIFHNSTDFQDPAMYKGSGLDGWNINEPTSNIEQSYSNSWGESKATELSPEAPCPKCGSYKTILEDKSSLGYGKRRQYVCLNCYNIFQSEYSPKEIKAMYRDGTSPYDRNRWGYFREAYATEGGHFTCPNCGQEHNNESFDEGDGNPYRGSIGCGRCGTRYTPMGNPQGGYVTYVEGTVPKGQGSTYDFLAKKYGWESKATEQQFIKSSQVFKNYNYPDGLTRNEITGLPLKSAQCKICGQELTIDNDIFAEKHLEDEHGFKIVYGESKYTIEDDFDESDQNDGEIQEKYVRGYENDWKDKLDTWDGRAVSDNFTTVQPYDPVNPKYECIYCGKEFSWDDTFTHDGSHGTLPSPYEDMGNT